MIVSSPEMKFFYDAATLMRCMQHEGASINGRGRLILTQRKVDMLRV